MTAELLKIDLNENGGSHAFTTFDQLISWLADEQEQWRWMQSVSVPGNPWDAVSSAFAQLGREIIQTENSGHPVSNLSPTLLRWFSLDHMDGILHHEGVLGTRVLEIKAIDGEEAAATAYSFAKGRIGIGSASNVKQLRGLLKIALPGVDHADAVAQRFKLERANTRSHWRQLLTDQKEQARAGEERRRKEHLRTRRLIAKALARRSKALAAERVQREELDAAAIRDIYATKATFEEFMHLGAPVDYWNKKANQHLDAEKPARTRVLAFFPVAAILLGTAFYVAASMILEHKTTVPAPVLFVVSGGLATLAGLVFWAGRLLTKLYLSEHHLRHDAEERAVMTSTYLALTSDAAAEQADRQIILTALFRNTPDGIVKEDSPPDLSVATILARLATPK